MVNFALPLFALGMAASIAASPVADTTFSFSAWVEDIIANPDTALSADEAVDAAIAAANVTNSGNLLSKRLNCDPPGFRPAPARDAAACVEDLARKGRSGIDCVIPAGQSNIQMCRIGNAVIVGSRADSARQSANCNDVARAIGFVFDSCYRPQDDTVKGSEIVPTNNRMQANVNRA
ncbi:hypothetical protein B0T16DRAFT_417207 [Cercophora newfieldiana]|uniref:Uncharacterized protein n=1 Tax=Cercophora newfieldiana TaxID=92897 RepID=A0AA40CMR8_9PEZI|nr:hypothetical protein B0T16DRAFT_417207 [Cercophora newfieldiana]